MSLYTTLPASQIAYILKDSGAKILVVSSSLQLTQGRRGDGRVPDLGLVVAMSELKKEAAAAR